MIGVGEPKKPVAHEPWYKYGIAFLIFEIAIAIAVSAYALAMTFGAFADR